MIKRRTMLAVAALAAATRLPKAQADTPKTIQIGSTMPYSGPASSYGVIGRTERAFFKWSTTTAVWMAIRSSSFSYDDGYSPPKTVEQIRRLIEADDVDFTFQNSRHANQLRRRRLHEPPESAATVCRLRCQ